MPTVKPTIVIGLGYGDCGKGGIVDYLSRRDDVHTVVRFNGGPQAGHNVVTADGRHHTFSQFGSGSFAGVRTLLSRFMLIEPYAMLNEALHLQKLGLNDIWEGLFIDENCLVITPPQQAANRLRELARGNAAHGTCGQGVGEATADALEHPERSLMARHLDDSRLVAERLVEIADRKLEQLRPLLKMLGKLPAAENDLRVLSNRDWIDVAVDAYSTVAGKVKIISTETAIAMLQAGGVIFEGAQGVLLDQDFGFHPHTTWSRTTTANALELLKDAGITVPPRRIGVLRSYMTRHGRGPLVTEDTRLTAALSEPHNNGTGHQGSFRVGVFDSVAARYAIAVAQVDELAITHLDRLSQLPGRFCSAYESDAGPVSLDARFHADLNTRQALTRTIAQCRPVFESIGEMNPSGFLGMVRSRLGLPVSIVSFGPTAKEKQALRGNQW